MEKTQSWLKLYKSFLKWEWYDDINTKILFIHLLLKANYLEHNWRGITIKRGQHLTGLLSLSKETGLTIQQIRTSLDKLISTNEITKVSTPQYTIITITNYDKYQTDNKGSNKRATNEQQTSNNSNRKNRINRNISKDRSEKSDTYGDKELDSFKNVLKKYYPFPIDGISNRRVLHNIRQLCTPRKSGDDWMSDKWQDNFNMFYKAYRKSTEDKYLVRDIYKLKEKVKLWREYGGRFK